MKKPNLPKLLTTVTVFFQKSLKIISLDYKRIENYFSSTKSQYELHLKTKTVEVVKNHGRFGFFNFHN